MVVMNAATGKCLQPGFRDLQALPGRTRRTPAPSPPFKITQFVDDGVLFTASMRPTSKITIFSAYMEKKKKKNQRGKRSKFADSSSDLDDGK